MEYADHVVRLRERYPDLATDLAAFSSLKHVLDWMQLRGLPLAAIDVVTQDEFSHDFLLPLGDGDCHLAFGMT